MEQFLNRFRFTALVPAMPPKKKPAKAKGTPKKAACQET